MADHAELIANFVAVSGAIPEQAQFYFEVNSWDIDVTCKQARQMQHHEQHLLPFVCMTSSIYTFSFHFIGCHEQVL